MKKKETTRGLGMDKQLEERFKKIKLLALDVDGTMTDGGVYTSSDDFSLKRFNTHDGMGIVMLRDLGVEVAIISTSVNDLIKRRAEALELTHFYLGVQQKYEKLLEIANTLGLKDEEIAFMGDDVNDYSIISNIQNGIAVGNAVEPIKKAAFYTTKALGGHGAVREIADIIIKAQTGQDLYIPKHFRQ